MGLFTAGEVVILNFPFSNLQGSKVRPALLLAQSSHTDWIACQITSNPFADKTAVQLTPQEFVSGGLQRVSYLRPGKIFTAEESILLKSVGHSLRRLSILREKLVSASSSISR